ncbi:hypothetical protein QRN89_16120 [Streptomyces chengbuensis]|uniref:hypothetical protein n=1 Tax=Streptomyces TaxID=1883 RepID=UPI0025B524D2|nr:hypothetical protein [Streptomyces sp. HUAS CB01]WJY51201.1 hypothetical protein QRN89_16120 [Streptomyces sp. HUAS CB01]
MRRRIVAALSAGAAGLALGVMPATGAFAASQVTADRGCSDWRGGGCGYYDDYRDYRHHDRYYDRYYDDFDRNFNDVVVILVAVR